MSEENKDKKCGRCKVYRYPSEFLKKGRVLKTCQVCRDICYKSRNRNKNKCEHNRRKNQCKDCNTGYCEHGRQKSLCKDCKTGYCEHDRQKNQCKICDLPGYITMTVRSRIYSSLKSNKELPSKEYLGCNITTFKQHIEKQFKKDMTWDNHGEWHIDHIIPVKYKQDGVEPSLEEVKKRLHYLNTQPLWATENFAKGNRYIG